MCVFRNRYLGSLKCTKALNNSALTFKPNWCQIRKLHVSQPNLAIPPILLLFVRPVMKISAMLFGRTIRKWWQRLSPDERKRMLEKLRGKQKQISAGFTILAGLGLFFYIEHIEEEPITKRKRFILYNEKQMESIAEIEFENQVETFKSEIMPPSHRIYGRVVRVANRILEANKTLPEIASKKWAVTVVDRPDIANALVLPHGKIIIFTGILNIASNDDQLALVIAHEMSHALLQHMSENLSKVFYVEMILLVPLVLFWALLPDAAALFTQWLSSRLADIMIHLPFSRFIETEADVVGMELAAKACYDVREAPVFWGKMAEVRWG